MIEIVQWNLPGGGEDTQRNRQIVAPAFLGQIGGRQIDRNAPHRKFEVGSLQGRAHPILRLFDLGLRQTNDGERRQAVGQMRFHGNQRRMHTGKGATEQHSE